ncbi:hypothetical protein EMCRGX_G020615 [Ephydatia muelleri]|eukprot:Em0016g573a
MTYVIREVQGLPVASKGRLLDTVSYPPCEIVNNITVLTKITLWEIECNVGGMMSWSYWRSVFNRRPDYNVLIQQNDRIHDATHTFVLHESDNPDVSRAAFHAVCETLEPLVDDCSLVLSQQLLEGIVVPKPREPEDLAEVITELMETNPNAHPDWIKVLQTLTLQAIGQDDVQHLSSLVGKGAKIDTLLHHAITAGSLKSIRFLTSSVSEELFHATNEDGKAAIHCAFEKNNPEMVTHLIESGADIAMPVNDEEGSNSLHLAAQNNSFLSIEAAHHRKKEFLMQYNDYKLERENALNAPNRKGFTPLMIAVRNGFLDSTVSLLAAEANPNVQHMDTGNTALHYAANQGNVILVKALVAFGADFAIQNKEGKSPLDEACMASEGDHEACVKVLQEIMDLTKEAHDLYADVPKVPQMPPDAVFLLCLDGGGVRGLLSLQILLAIRNRMKHIQPDCAPFQDYFDYVAGTSIGGLIALSSCALKASLEAGRAAIFKVVDEVFSTPRTFTVDVSDDIAKDTFGIDMKITDFNTPRVVVHTVEANTNPPTLLKIKNFGRNKSADWKVWEAARATTAAPIYFPPHCDKYIDGGVMANNPTLSGMSEIFIAQEEEGKAAKFGLVVSIGTGYIAPMQVDHIGVYVPSLCNLLSIPSTLSALGNVLNLLIGQSTTSDGEVVNHARSWCKSLGAEYFRLSPELSTPIDLAEHKKEPIIQMLYEGFIYGLKNAKEIDKIARIILSKKCCISASQ